jgi:hypothetical protein
MSQTAPPRSPIEEVAEFFARGPSLTEIAHFQLSDAAQASISELLEKEDDGTLTVEERHQLDELLVVNDLVTLIRSRVPPSVPSRTTNDQA